MRTSSPHPYREPGVPAPPPRVDRGVPVEETITYGGLAALGLGRVGVALAVAEAFGPEVTIAAALGLAGLVGLVGQWRRWRPSV